MGTELRTPVGTQGFLAPELLGTLPKRFCSNGNSYNNTVDIWALGCLVYNMFTLETPFLAPAPVGEGSITSGISDQEYRQRGTDFSLFHQYCHGENHVASSLKKFNVAKSEIAFVGRLLVVDPKSRSSAAAALMDPWFLPPLHVLGPSPIKNKTISLRDHHTLLAEVANNGRVDLVRTFLTAGADVRWTNDAGDGALHFAAKNGHHDVVEVLLEKDADLNAALNKDGTTALHEAAYGGHEAVVRLLLEKGADPNAKDNYGQTALHHAAYRGHEAVVRLLLGKSVDLGALHSAALGGSEGIIGLLLKNSADASAVDIEGTPMRSHSQSYM